MKNVIKIIKAISDQNRVRILHMLNSKTLCVCEIAYILKLAQPTVSKHLKQLKDVDLINEQKEGKWVNYQLNKELDKNSCAYKYLQLTLECLDNDFQINNDIDQISDGLREHICSNEKLIS